MANKHGSRDNPHQIGEYNSQQKHQPTGVNMIIPLLDDLEVPILGNLRKIQLSIHTHIPIYIYIMYQ